MSTVNISMISATRAKIEFTVCKYGKNIAAGGVEKVSVIIEDSEQLRLCLANLDHLKRNGFTGPIRMRFNDLHQYTMSSDIWYELCDALFAFALSVDFERLAA